MQSGFLISRYIDTPYSRCFKHRLKVSSRPAFIRLSLKEKTMRILYAPDSFVLVCPEDSTVVEVEKSEVYFENNGWIHYQPRDKGNVLCPTCGHFFDSDDIQLPKLVLDEEDGKCPYCGTPVGSSDEFCNRCGHAIERKGEVKIKV